MTGQEWAPLVEAVAARRPDRLPDRGDAGRRRRDPDLPVLCDGEAAVAKHKEEFGTTGAIEGVAGPEAANNASAAGVLVPMLTLGLPTSATAAIMLSAFQSYGINPGPLLSPTQPISSGAWSPACSSPTCCSWCSTCR